MNDSEKLKPLLSRRLEFGIGGAVSVVNIEIFAPVVADGAASCKLRIDAIREEPFVIRGLDEMQVVALAIQFADSQIEAIADGRQWRLVRPIERS
jgi:hypothetical protein